MQLARHSDPKLTMARYGRAQLHDLAAAVEKLPGLLPPPRNQSQTLAATGTYPTAHSPQHSPAREIRSLSLITADTGERSETYEEQSTETLQIKPLETGCDKLTTADYELPPARFELATYGLGNRRSIP